MCAKKITLQDYKTKLKEKFGDRFDVLSTEYINNKSKLIFRCDECGSIFENRADNQLSKGSCKGCVQIDRYKFIWKAIQKHGYKFDYREVDYKNNADKIKIGCPEHGFFEINPSFHLSNQYGGCPSCNPYSFKSRGIKKQTNFRKDYNTESFKKKVEEIFDGTISVDDVEYIKSTEKIQAYCIIHDRYFETTPHKLLTGHGCKLCGIEKSRKKKLLKVENVIKIANKAHDYNYDYSEIDYQGMSKDIYPICKEHGKFKVNAYNHLFHHCGCPECSLRKHYSEKQLYDYVKETFSDALYNYHNPKLLGRLSLDIYIPSLKVGIEFQGEQHFRPVDWFGGEKSFQKIMDRDKRKKEICRKNGIQLFYLTKYKVPDGFDEYYVYKDRERLMEDIKESAKSHDLAD